ncbi:MAG: ATP-dependent DNA helicase RecQ [Bacteroidales bacterium]
MPLKSILVKYWGYTEFRPLQEDIIKSVMDGRDTLALLPTGGGKSVCFQVPALAKDGLCLVITPLIALMQDQVENLKRRDINAAAIYSGMNQRQIELVLDNCMFGDVKFLYLSPERLETEKFLAVLPRLPVNLIAVDEAHCISQWGYDFRPPYLRIAAIREFLPDVPVLALTATATPLVVRDIQNKLSFKEENVFQKSFERSNLTYVVQHEEDKMGRLLKICNRINGTGIVYVRNRRKTREIAEFLNKNIISANFYHAGLDTTTRDNRQAAWMKGEVRVMVSTNAFGMGVDKPNVRFVVHTDLPDSLEAYFQEAGRGGRDGNQSYAVILYDNSDIIELKHNLNLTYPAVDVIKQVYHTLGNYYQLATGSGKDRSYDFELSEFCNRYNLNPVVSYNALKFLEKEGYISLNEEVGSPSLINIRVKKDNLYRFQVENPYYDSFIKLILRSYTGLFTTFVRISEAEIARRMPMPVNDVIRNLHALNKFGLISYVPRKEKPQLIFLTERLDVSSLQISTYNYKDRLDAAKTRLESVIHYVQNRDTCRSIMLLDYFGEKDGKRCGKCDVCVERNRMELKDIEFNKIVEQIKQLLSKQALSMEEIVGLIKGFNDDKILKAFRWLLENDRIVATDLYKFRWKTGNVKNERKRNNELF